MNAADKRQHIKKLTSYPWTGQAVENFYSPRSSWQDDCTLAERFNKQTASLSSFINCFSWAETPQGGRYWSLLCSEVM